MIKPDFKNFTKKQRCLFGAMLGDIIGAGFEFKQPEHIKREQIENPKSVIDSHTWLPVCAGRYTDDFSQTLCVENCINNNLSFDDELVLWFDGKYWVNDFGFDYGFQTCLGIQHFIENGEYLSQPNRSGNGLIMRLAPLAFCDDPLVRVNQFSLITHNNKESLNAAHLYVYILSTLYKSGAKNKLAEFTQTFDNMSNFLDIKYPTQKKYGNGYVIDTLDSIRYCMTNSDSFESAIINAVMCGHDTDTTASCVGAIAGLVYDYEEISPEWLEYIQPSLKNKYVKDLFGIA